MAPTDEVAVRFQDGVLTLTGALTVRTVGAAERACAQGVRGPVRLVDGAGIAALDTAGAVFVRRIAGPGGELRGFGADAGRLLDLLSRTATEASGSESTARRSGAAETRGDRSAGVTGRLERLGDAALRAVGRLEEIAVLVADILWWSLVGLLDRSQYRRGAFTEQALLMGSSALPIVVTIMFLIGAISALQSAATLRSFGATVFVVDMLAIGLARELAPLMTAIIVSGRSGSAIASEVATMKFTEEIDALRTMGLNPLRFVVVPKMWAMVVSLPLLSMLALAFGILGGFVVAVTYMDLTVSTFFNRLFVSLLAWDIVTGLIKSVSFAIIITVVGVYRGLNFQGGADGVGRATTASVVTAIFAMIVVDSIWGILFYL